MADYNQIGHIAMRRIRCGLLLALWRGPAVCSSVWLLITSVSCAKTDEPIEMSSGTRSAINRALSSQPDLTHRRGSFQHHT